MKGQLTRKGKEGLLRTARRSIEAAFVEEPYNPTDAAPAVSNDTRGVFVTLTRAGHLRGCIGTLAAQEGVERAVAEYARHAAFSDPRFPPLAVKELAEIRIEISLLSPPCLAQGPEDIVIGRDGLIIEFGGRRGLLLPQVATEWGFDRLQFLDEVCRKAGLPAGTWKNPEARLYAFEAEVFGEGEGAEEQKT